MNWKIGAAALCVGVFPTLTTLAQGYDQHKLTPPLPIVQPPAAAPAAPKVTPPAATQPPAPPVAATTPAPAKCKDVLFTRPDVGKPRHFMITIRQGDLDAIKACSPKLDVHQTQNGVGVVITYGDGGAVISLPDSLADDSASNVRCVNNETGDVVNAVVYKADWTGGLPPKVDLKPLDEAFFDKPALMNACRRLTAEHKFHQ